MCRLRIYSLMDKSRDEMATNEPSSSSIQPMLDSTAIGFLDDAIIAMDKFCMNWRTNHSYILPPVFELLSLPRAVQIESARLSTGDLMLNVRHEDAASIVSDAIQHLTKCEGIYHPFVAFRNLDFHRLNTNVLSVPHFFNSPKARAAYERCLREYDFVLIGPKIGMIFIEVSASPFGIDFKPSSKLPDRYKRRLESLKESDMLFVLLRTLTNFTKETFELESELPIKRVFITPKLEKTKMDLWWSTLNDEGLARDICHFDGITTWFKEDAVDRSPRGKAYLPPLYTALHRLLSESSVQMSQQIYEAFVPILIVMQSVIDPLVIEQPPLAKGVQEKRQRKSKPSPIALDLSRIFGPGWKAHRCTTPDSQNSLIAPILAAADQDLQPKLDIAVRIEKKSSTISDLLATYCPGLAYPIEPSSYVLPPRFSYSHPDNPKYSDDYIRQCDKGTPQWKHRTVRESIRPIMDAIDELVRRGTSADPFLAVEGLDLKAAENDLIPQLLGGDKSLIDSHRPCFRQFDIVLIGERIGVIVIEIRGSEFAREFTPQFNRLPKRYANAFEALITADSLRSLIEHGAKFEIPSTPVRKIVVALRLSKSRYDQWFGSLDDEKKISIHDTVGSTRQWFEEDLTNGFMIDKLRELIDEPGYAIDQPQSRRGIQILALLKAWPIFKNFRDEQCRMEKLKSLFSEQHARMNDSMALELQNPEIVSENPRIMVKDKFIILTPEQLAASRGPDRQLIFGTGGTGKTIVLMHRAIECLERGRSILVLATESYMQSYYDLLEPVFQRGTHAGAKLEVRSWPKTLWSILDVVPTCHRIMWDIYHNEIHVVELASKLATSESGKQMFRFMDEFDAVFIDDTLDYTRTVGLRVNTNMKALFVALAMMSYAKEFASRTKIMSIGLDQTVIEWRYDRQARIYRDTLERLRADQSISSGLTRVMRNGDEIFKLAYEPQFASQLEPYRPVCGHKIPGRVYCVSVRRPEILWREIEVFLEKYLVEQEYKRSQIAIIIGGTASFAQMDKVFNLLLRKCRESKIPTETLDYQKLHREKLKGSESFDASTICAVEDEKIWIDFWHQVSSREWSIVIHVNLIDFGRVTHSFDAVRIYHQYRARTRAVSQLVELCVVPSTSKRELLKCRISHCCTREIELDLKEDLTCLDSCEYARYVPSNIHDFHCKRQCLKFADGTYRSENWTERLDDVANVALQLRDDLFRDLYQGKHCITREVRSDYETRLFNKIRKRCHSISDFRSTNDARHPALVLDCDLFEIVSRRRMFPLHTDKESKLWKLEEIETYFQNRDGTFWVLAIKLDIIKLMEKVLWWIQLSSPTKEERQKEIDEHQNLLAMALDSTNNITKFSECILEVARITSSFSPALAEYFRVNIIKICEVELHHERSQDLASFDDDDDEQVCEETNRCPSNQVKDLAETSEQVLTLTRSESPPSSLSSSTSRITSAESPKSFNQFDRPLITLAKHYLDMYCTGWNENGLMARSHIIPSVFVYKNPRLPDDKIQEWELKKATMKAEERRDLGFPREDRDSIDRQSDHAEYIVFDAIQRLIREQGSYHPFLAFYRLDTHQLRTSFESVFPGLDSEKVKAIFEKQGSNGWEYDFVLIGPHIGIIVIEVKGSPFSVGDKKRLPERFRHGLVQLKSTDHLLDILKLVTNRLDWKFDGTQIRKVLFTPNLPRDRYEGWLGAMDDGQRIRFQEDVRGIVLWFREDMENALETDVTNRDPLPPLYSALHRLLSDSTENTMLPFDVYESFAVVMSVMATVTGSSRLSTTRWRQYDLDESKFFRVGTQARGNIPVKMLELTDQELEWKKRSERMKWKKRSTTSSSSIYSDNLVMLEPNRHLFLTLEQQEALNGPNRQLIIGAAGSGKTVLLQLKATELMERGRSVLVVTSNNKADSYRRLFDVNFQDRYEVKPWSAFHQYDIARDDHLLLDDISDATIDELLRVKLTMSPNHSMADRLIWIAVDPFMWKWKMQNREIMRNNDGNTHPLTIPTIEPADRCPLTSEDRLQPAVSELIDDCADRQIDLLAKAFEWFNSRCNGLFSASFLRRVIRSPITVFKETYRTLDWTVRPWLGHQIPGPQVQRINIELEAVLMFQSDLERHSVVDALSEKLKEPLDELITEFEFDQIALIYQIEPRWENTFRDCLCDIVNHLVLHTSKELGDRDTASKRIFQYSEVSSMEFPGVMFLSVISKDSDEQLVEYASYCARTRCMQKLIDVRCHFFLPLAIPVISNFKSPPTQSRPIDESVVEEIQSKMKSESEQAVSICLEQLKLEEAKLDDQLQSKRVELQCHESGRYETKVKTDIEALRRLARETIGIDADKVNICVTGQRGVGKSSTINGLRGLKAGDHGAAKVDVNETTMKIQRYTFPGADHLVIWDVPGFGTLNHLGSTCFLDKFLYAFDYLLVIFTNDLGEAEIDMVKQAIAYHVPFSIVRNKANVDLDGLRKDNQHYAKLSKEEGNVDLIREHRRKIVDRLRQAEIDPKRAEIFVINAWAFTDKDETAFEEGKLIDHIMNTVAEDRYRQRPSTTTK